jgi:hypothetical protein
MAVFAGLPKRALAVLPGLCCAAVLGGCTSVAQVTTLSEPSCGETVATALSRVLETQGESAPVAKQLAESTTLALRSGGWGPRPFLVASPSGVDYAFFVERDSSSCLLRLYGRQKGFVTYTNNLSYIATEPLAPCQCAESGEELGARVTAAASPPSARSRRTGSGRPCPSSRGGWCRRTSCSRSKACRRGWFRWRAFRQCRNSL